MALVRVVVDDDWFMVIQGRHVAHVRMRRINGSKQDRIVTTTIAFKHRKLRYDFERCKQAHVTHKICDVIVGWNVRRVGEEEGEVDGDEKEDSNDDELRLASELSSRQKQNHDAVMTS